MKTRLWILVAVLALVAAACGDDGSGGLFTDPSQATTAATSGDTIATASTATTTATGARYSDSIRGLYLAGCAADGNQAFCECTLGELEQMFTEDEFIRFAIETTEEMPPEAVEVAVACLDLMDFEGAGTADTPPATASTAELVSVFDLQPGDCFDDDASGLTAQASQVPMVPCSQPHDNEIFSEYAMTDAAFPGSDAALEDALFACVDMFEPFVGIPYADSALDVFPITPSAESWDLGDRAVFCVLYNLDLSKMEGSMAGSRR